MPYSKKRLRKIYDCTSGYCHLCRKKIAFKNYGKLGARGAWEVEHSKPKSNGGTDHLNNLYAACISCNRKKGNSNNRVIREQHGVKRAPLSKKDRKKAKKENAILFGITGGIIGSILGPWGLVAGSIIGANIGKKRNPDKD